MKLRYIGGHKETVSIDGETTDLDQLTQVFEQTEYFWPSPGSILTVPDNIGGWLLGKHRAVLEEIPERIVKTDNVRRVVAVVPAEEAPPAPPPAPPPDE